MREFIETILIFLREIEQVKYVSVWNNNLDRMEDGTSWTFPLPSLFIELISPMQIKSEGNGSMLYDPLDIKIHLLVEQIDSMDGYFDQNLAFIDLVDAVSLHLAAYEPSFSSTWDLVSMEFDYNHTNVYHCMFTYRTTFRDTRLCAPIHRTTRQQPITISPTITINNG